MKAGQPFVFVDESAKRQRDVSERVVEGPQSVHYFLGDASAYNPVHPLAEQLPEGDKGGRDFALVPGHSPAELFDQTNPALAAIHMQAMREAQLRQTPLPAAGILVQGIQMTWIFAAQEIALLRAEVAELREVVQLLKTHVDLRKVQVESKPETKPDPEE